MRSHSMASSLFIGFFGIFSSSALAADECTGFKWDVSKEHALFGGPSATLTAGKGAPSAPIIGTNRLYLLQLSPQSDVAFAVAPGKKIPAEDAYAGLTLLKIDDPGNYRVSVDVPLWIDVVVDGKLVTPVDYQGQRDCSAPHKIVEFDLSGARQFVLQVSGSTTTNVRLAVTPATARKN